MTEVYDEAGRRLYVGRPVRIGDTRAEILDIDIRDYDACRGEVAGYADVGCDSLPLWPAPGGVLVCFDCAAA